MIRLAVLLALACLLPTAGAEAAGLVWQLPEDGTSVVFAGTRTQTVRRAGSTEQDESLTFNRTLEVRSVGETTADVDGSSVPARWLEFESITTGPVGDAGPGGSWIYKVLVPTDAVSDAVANSKGIPNAFLPIVRGWSQHDGGDPMSIESAIFNPYPTLTLLRTPPSLTETGSEAVDAGGQSFDAAAWKAQESIESREERSRVETQVLRSDEAPFGVVGWEVRVALEEKVSTAPRSDFEERTEVREEMTLSEVRDGAVSRLARD